MKGNRYLFFIILLLGIGFATVSTVLYINGNVNIEANSEDFDVVFTRSLIDNEDRTSETISADGKTINFTTNELQVLNDKSVLEFEVTNNSSLYDAEISIECVTGERGDYYQITKEVASTIPSKTTDKGKVEVEKIKLLTEDIEEKFTCTLTARAVERTTKGEKPLNINIEKGAIFNEETCKTGDESTCIETDCYKNKIANSCSAGTIIKYRVNNTTTKTFNVLSDNGETITLQDNISTTEPKNWYLEKDNTHGPIVALQALEEETSNWSNVISQTYTMGTTAFKNNFYTGCDDSFNCTTNTYTLGQKTSKARMITLQEAVELGCNVDDNSCPKWMYSSGSFWYWTMSAFSINTNYAWAVYGNRGRVFIGNTDDTSGCRAVVVISK